MASSPVRALREGGNQSNMDVDYVISFRFATTGKFNENTVAAVH